MTKYGTAYYGSPISIYGLDNAVPKIEVVNRKERKVGKTRMGKADLDSG